MRRPLTWNRARSSVVSDTPTHAAAASAIVSKLCASLRHTYQTTLKLRYLHRVHDNDTSEVWNQFLSVLP
jgi:hypothetical protein